MSANHSTPSTFSTTNFVASVTVFQTTGPICFLLCLQILVLNSFVIHHYKKSRKSFVPMMYIMISAADAINAISVTLQTIAVVLFVQGVIVKDGLKWCYLTSYTISSISYRTSVFYNVVLAVSRTINILNPFYRIKKKVVFVICLLYPVPWMALLAYDLHYFVDGDGWMAGLAKPLAGIKLTLIDTENMYLFHFLFILILAIPFLIPAVVVIVTCFIQIVALYTTSLQGNQRYITITILMLSSLFVFCNSIFSSCMIALVLDSVAYDYENQYLYGVVLGTILPAFNAAFNPVIIISRSREIRKRFVELVGRVRKEVRNVVGSRGSSVGLEKEGSGGLDRGDGEDKGDGGDTAISNVRDVGQENKIEVNGNENGCDKNDLFDDVSLQSLNDNGKGFEGITDANDTNDIRDTVFVNETAFEDDSEKLQLGSYSQ